MLHVPIRQAKPGMKLALPVQHPRHHTMLLSEGFELDNKLISKLRELEIHGVWIEYPNTEDIKHYVSPDILKHQSQVVGMVSEMFEKIHQEAFAELDFARYRKTLQGLVESVVSEPTAASYIVELGGRADSELRHACEVCFLSILLGLKLQGYLIEQRKRLRPSEARDVVSLGVGAILHDVGLLALDEEVRNKYLRSRDEGDSEWRQHVHLGYKMVNGLISAPAAGVVLHHHQHFDGSGFPVTPGPDGDPRGLRGENIHIFARIVCVANNYDRLRRPNSGTQIPRVKVLKNLVTYPLVSRFDSVVLAALLRVAPAYPPGSLVKLNTGQSAVVTDWHSDSPCQPTVQLLTESESSESDPVTFDLRQNPELLIVDHEGEDVQKDNFHVHDFEHVHKKSAA